MIQFFAKRMKNKKGFTLVELLIVIAVLGILAAIAVPRFVGVTTTVREKADKESANMMARQIEVFIMTGQIAVTDTEETITQADYKEPLPKPQVSGKSAFTIKVKKNGSGATINIYYDDDTDALLTKEIPEVLIESEKPAETPDADGKTDGK